ncbi:hypothetical protein I4U23_016323 [Adineta vaga]|nr:hypothetical protein I4U23_016323 [Adineta vaga]
METKIKIAKLLDSFGVEYIEVTSPMASPQSKLDCEAICQLGLNAKMLTHIRCNMEDAKIAVATGVTGVNVFFGMSPLLCTHSHGKGMAHIEKTAIEVINFLKDNGLEVRFSTEDTFRSNLADILSIYTTVDKIGVDRVGIADTVGVAHPRQVYELVQTVRRHVSCDIEVHFHNDTGCAIANAYAALEAGATHIDTCVLGIGERNGITSLGGLCARMYVADKEYIKNKYSIKMLSDLEKTVAVACNIEIPFNNYITGAYAFTHKAGLHIKAVAANPLTYEILDPSEFGVSRSLHIGHRLTGWHAIRLRANDLNISLSDAHIKQVTQNIKYLADTCLLTTEGVDQILHDYYSHVQENT